MEGFYVVYNGGAGLFGFCGNNPNRPPFDCKGHAIVFPSRKEARAALKGYRQYYGVTHLTPSAARRFSIKPTENSYIKNK